LENDLGTAETVVCYCFHKTAAELRSEILKLCIQTSEEAARKLCAGNGCTLCRPSIDAILREVRRGGRSSP